MFVICAVLLFSAAAVAKPVKVITVTENGTPIKAKITVRSFPGGDSSAHVMTEGRGYSTIWIEDCSERVSINATADVIGIVRKIDDDRPDWLPCKEPEIVFNDFLIQSFAFSPDNPVFTNTEFWKNTLGETTVAARPRLPTEIVSAFEDKQYGKISIIATEIQYALRAAGKPHEADFLYSLAVGASASEIMSTYQPSGAQALVYSAETNRFELSSEARASISDYQMRVLGVPQSSPNLGKIDWTTMRALEGGTAVRVPDIDFGAAELSTFSIDKDILGISQ